MPEIEVGQLVTLQIWRGGRDPVTNEPTLTARYIAGKVDHVSKDDDVIAVVFVRTFTMVGDEARPLTARNDCMTHAQFAAKYAWGDKGWSGVDDKPAPVALPTPEPEADPVVGEEAQPLIIEQASER